MLKLAQKLISRNQLFQHQLLTNAYFSSPSTLSPNPQNHPKYIDTQAIKFPNQNAVPDAKATLAGKETKIVTYSYPPDSSKSVKGLVFYHHGYGDYCGEMAYYAKELANAGYHFLGYDAPGFGQSEGKRGYIYTYDEYINNVLDFIEKGTELYGGSNLPRFNIGFSNGGLITLLLASNEERSKFQGSIYLAPFFGGNANLLQRAHWAPKIAPYFKTMPISPLNLEKGDWQQTHYNDFYVFQGYLTAQSITQAFVQLAQLPTLFPKNNTPTLMILGANDTVVCNKSAINFFEKSPVQDKHKIAIDDLDHMIMYDGEHFHRLVEEQIKWLDQHI